MLKLPALERDVLLDPHRQHVGELVVGDRLEDRDGHDRDRARAMTRQSARQSSRGALASCGAPLAPAGGDSRTGRWRAREHEHRGDAEAEVPAVDLREQAAEQRSDDRAEVDAVLKIAKPRVRRASSSRGYSAPTCAEMLPFRNPEPSTSSSRASRNDWSNAIARWPAAHRQRADHDGVALADPAVGDQAAEQRREIHEAGVEAEDLRGERLRRQRPDHRFDRGAEPGEPGDVLDVSRQQQLVDHVQHQQRRHAVEREALPRLGEGEIEEPFRMTRETGSGRARPRRFDCAQWFAPVLPTRLGSCCNSCSSRRTIRPRAPEVPRSSRRALNIRASTEPG